MSTTITLRCGIKQAGRDRLEEAVLRSSVWPMREQLVLCIFGPLQMVPWRAQTPEMEKETTVSIKPPNLNRTNGQQAWKHLKTLEVAPSNHLNTPHLVDNFSISIWYRPPIYWFQSAQCWYCSSTPVFQTCSTAVCPFNTHLRKSAAYTIEPNTL